MRLAWPLQLRDCDHLYRGNGRLAPKVYSIEIRGEAMVI